MSKNPRRRNDETENKLALKIDVDYYVERGMIVFTEHYHLKRGSCCNSGCRHCPYQKIKT